MVKTNDTSVPQVTATTNAVGRVMGPAQPSGTQLWGHTIIFRDESVECKRCNEEFEVPEIFRASRALHETAYRMYICGKFKHMDCGIDYEDMIEDGDTITTDRISDLYSPHPDLPQDVNVYWSTGSGSGSSDEDKMRLRERFKVGTSH